MLLRRAATILRPFSVTTNAASLFVSTSNQQEPLRRCYSIDGGGVPTPSTRRKVRQVGPTSVDNFNVIAREVMIQIKHALEPLVENKLNNYVMTFNTDDEILLDTGSDGYGHRGWFIFRIDRTQERLTFTSPISAVLQYEYNVEEKQWLNVSDRHDLRGIITRDLLRHQCKGVPNF